MDTDEHGGPCGWPHGLMGVADEKRQKTGAAQHADVLAMLLAARNVSWSAVARRSRDTAFVRTVAFERSIQYRAGESGVAFLPAAIHDTEVLATSSGICVTIWEKDTNFHGQFRPWDSGWGKCRCG
jgi:hypothetical protein